jgi:hypothetical protein
MIRTIIDARTRTASRQNTLPRSFNHYGLSKQMHRLRPSNDKVAPYAGIVVTSTNALATSR